MSVAPPQTSALSSTAPVDAAPADAGGRTSAGSPRLPATAVEEGSRTPTRSDLPRDAGSTATVLPVAPSVVASGAGLEAALPPRAQRDDGPAILPSLDGPATPAPDAPLQGQDAAAAPSLPRPREAGSSGAVETSGRAADASASLALPIDGPVLPDKADAARTPDPLIDGPRSSDGSARDLRPVGPVGTAPATRDMGSAPPPSRLVQAGDPASRGDRMEPGPAPALPARPSAAGSEDVTVYFIGFVVLALSGYLMSSLMRSRYAER